MLLANVSVAKKIYHEFPQSAVLRRHPIPPYSNFDPMLAVCKAYVSVSAHSVLFTFSLPLSLSHYHEYTGYTHGCIQ